MRSLLCLESQPPPYGFLCTLRSREPGCQQPKIDTKIVLCDAGECIVFVHAFGGRIWTLERLANTTLFDRLACADAASVSPA